MSKARNLKSCEEYYTVTGNGPVAFNFVEFGKVIKNFSSELEKNPNYFEIPAWDWEGLPGGAKDFLELQAYDSSGDAFFWFTDWNGDNTGEWAYKGLRDADAWHKLVADLMSEGEFEGSGMTRYERVADYMSKLTVDQFETFLKDAGDETSTKLEMNDLRVRNLREVGSVLNNEYGGEFENFLNSCKWSAPEIVKKLSSEFPNAYGEDYVRQGDAVIYFDKRNHLVPILLYGGLKARNFEKEISGMKDITIASDYRIPEALRMMGLLEYSYQLAKKVDSNQIIEKGGDEEVAIRAAALLTAHSMMIELNERGHDINVAHIDAYLWKKGFESSTH
ncbi:MAG: hypothetical protein GOV00_01550, partial [Candidatus Altiarchaeota archaeon]|nr:hypothetical protein [Candidatus Altiarchaeota archaeon]